MNNNLSDQLKELEIERRSINKKKRIASAMVGIFLIIGFASFFWIPYLCIIFFVIAIIITFIAVSKVNKFKKKFKENVVVKLIKDELGVDAVYHMNGGIPIDEINSLEVASRPDRYQTEDYISCSYNGIPYEMCDCTLEEEVVTHDSHGNRQVSYRTYFKGRVIKIDFKRDLHIELKVVNQPTQGFQHRNLISFETEVIEFNKQFKCYASSKEDGFYIMTPIMIQKMLELEQMYKGGIYYVFLKGNLYILINNSGDSLEVNLSKPLDEKQITKIKSDLLIGASIINEFRMDSNKYNADI